ncbi:hypothetical protein IEQ34_001386 [Dendrobium chrysotoxum]|uniref:Disease resistance protein n=1 Tax=Dendrobium chrysotoxum TaxID=161865 RepID=A0AAV7HP09_DENCH|nr:hypothetical protein IEQ34_001386 [Dendrobium chrysotoxum]
MAMILDAFMSKFSTLLDDFVYEELIIVLGVKGDLQELHHRMRRIQCLLKDAEKKKFGESSTELWLYELKDVMYDAEDIIDLCRIESAELLADQNSESRTSSVCYDFSYVFSCFTSVPLRHEIENKIEEINNRLDTIYENRKYFKLEKSTISKTPQITQVDSCQTSSMDDPFVVGRDVEVAANRLVDRLLMEVVDEKYLLFAVIGMCGMRKTTLAQKKFNHSKIKTFFNLDPVWVCVSQNYSKIELLKQVIRGAKGSYGDTNTKLELQIILSDFVASGQSLFLVLDDVWWGDARVDLLRVPLYKSNVNVKVLVTTRYENVAMDMEAAHIHPVKHLSEESSWDMLRRRLFPEGQMEPANDLKELGFMIVRRCGCLPLAIKATATVLAGKKRTRKVWENFLKNDAWSISNLPEGVSGALFLSFEDLPSHLKQCFLYFSLYPEDALLDLSNFVQLWVAKGFVHEQKNLLMEDSAEECFNELLKRNLLLPHDLENYGKMHDLIRSLAIFLSKEETSFGDLNVRNSTRSIKLRHLSVVKQAAAVKILDSVADQGALRTLLASSSGLLLDGERLRQLLHLRVLDISCTRIQILPDSIGKLFHSTTIENLQQLNYLNSFVVANNDSCSKLEELNSLKQIRILSICNLEIAQSETIILKALPNLSTLTLKFSIVPPIPGKEQELAIEDLFDNIIPSQSLENFQISGFFGRRFPNWMVFSSSKIYVPYLTKLEIFEITSCTQLPPLGQLPELRVLNINHASKVKKIGPEFLGSGVNLTTRGAFPKLEKLYIGNMNLLEEWFFDAQVTCNPSLGLRLMPCLHILKIRYCPFLKQFPKDLKHRPVKSLNIEFSGIQKSLDNLPIELEKLKIICCKDFKKLGCLPKLKQLRIVACNAFSWMEKLQELYFHDIRKESLPVCLLLFLRQRGLQNDTNDDFQLSILCNEMVLRECLKEGSYWDLIQHIPRIRVYGDGYYL